MKKTIGKIHERPLFLRTEAGEADDGLNKYELSTNVVGGHPIVWNKTTGLAFTLNWSEIIGLAKKAGIDTMPKVKP